MMLTVGRRLEPWGRITAVGSVAQIPAGRYGDPAEFGSVAAFLRSRQASYVTGTALRCDGGLVRSL
jgi:3-oxoacyl-[acyl-carrier protein] reductase